MKYPIFDYSQAPQSDSVIVVAAGPSTAANSVKLLEYAKAHNSKIFAATYDYTGLNIHPHYTCFADIKKVKEQIHNAKTDLIIRGFTIQTNKDYIYSTLNGYSKNIYSFGNYRKHPTYEGHSVYGAKKIIFNEFGHISQSTIGITGLACFLMALMCKPKELLFVGIDGQRNKDGTKHMYDGSRVKDDLKAAKVIRYIQNGLFPFIRSLGVTIKTFESVHIYGLSKKDLGITLC